MEAWLGRKEEDHIVAQTPPLSNARAKWKAPPPQWIKCNTDGAWRKEHQRSRVGWISRDSRGKLLWAGVKDFQRVGSPIEAEAEGIKWATQSKRSLGYNQVPYETDSQVLARMITGQEVIWPKLEPVMQEIQHYLSENPGYKLGFIQGKEIRQQTE
ncbi:uncharacterized protein LOC106357268 [Brassica napus]|uniref:uncharacterized protein LOC106357268 n=1 Tax=Brassica napus TaxID=3708 RepID=UPI0006AB39C7|nr:uncharacterized protein LOC106357268 [Brassica napus]